MHLGSVTGGVPGWQTQRVGRLNDLYPKKLRNIGGDLGGAVKGFKDGMKPGDEEKKPDQLAEKSGVTVEGEVKDKQKS